MPVGQLEQRGWKNISVNFTALEFAVSLDGTRMLACGEASWVNSGEGWVEDTRVGCGIMAVRTWLNFNSGAT